MSYKSSFFITHWLTIKSGVHRNTASALFYYDLFFDILLSYKGLHQLEDLKKIEKFFIA